MISQVGNRPTAANLLLKSLAIIVAGTIGGFILMKVGLAFRDGLLQLVIVLAMALPAFALAWIDSPAVVTYVAGVWAFAPCVRRIFDWEIGAYQALSLISVAPLLVSLSLLIALFRARIVLPPKLRVHIILVGVAVLVALGMGVPKHGLAAILDFLNYFLPFCALLFLAARRPPPEYCDQILRGMVGICVVVAIYGWFQFIFMDPWDKLWMIHGGDMPTIGTPYPFKVRVFSTVNSPGPLGNCFAPVLAVAYLDKRWRGIGGWISVFLIVSCDLLSSARSGWVAAVVIIFSYSLCTGSRARAAGMIRILVAIAVLAITIPFLPGGQGIMTRFNSFGNLHKDESFNDRTSWGPEMFLHTLKLPFGMGLGAIGTSSKLGSNDDLTDTVDFDNGFLAVTYTFGQIGGIIIIGFIVRATSIAYRRARSSSAENRFARLGFASGMGFLALLLFGNALTGLMSFYMWLPIGLWMATDSGEPEPRSLESAAELVR